MRRTVGEAMPRSSCHSRYWLLLVDVGDEALGAVRLFQMFNVGMLAGLAMLLQHLHDICRDHIGSRSANDRDEDGGNEGWVILRSFGFLNTSGANIAAFGQFVPGSGKFGGADFQVRG